MLLRAVGMSGQKLFLQDKNILCVLKENYVVIHQIV